MIHAFVNLPIPELQELHFRITFTILFTALMTPFIFRLVAWLDNKL